MERDDSNVSTTSRSRRRHRFGSSDNDSMSAAHDFNNSWTIKDLQTLFADVKRETSVVQACMRNYRHAMKEILVTDFAKANNNEFSTVLYDLNQRSTQIDEMMKKVQHRKPKRECAPQSEMRIWAVVERLLGPI